MTKNNNIPQGYKDSPLGIIPEGWEVKSVKDFGKVLTGSTPPTSDQDNYGVDFLFVSPADLSDRKFITSTEKKLSIKGFSISRVMPKGTVLFTCIGSTIGKSGIASTNLTSNQQINAVICNKHNYNEFLYYELCYKSSRIKLIAGEQAVPIINKSDFENIKIIHPPLPEQQKIAEILSVWDEAIEKQTQLIAQFATRKRGLMQQLLTGKKRVKGFGGKWEEVKLGDIATFFSGGTPNTNISEYYVGDIPFIKSGEIHKSHTEQFISKEALSKSSAKLVEKEDILYALYGATSGECAISQIYGAINQAVLCIRTMENRKFILSVLQSNKQHYLDSYLQGGQGNLSAEIVKSYSLKLPSPKEQTAIANILSAADSEITLAKQKLARLKEQKKGLMQVLLTGKKRVKI